MQAKAHKGYHVDPVAGEAEKLPMWGWGYILKQEIWKHANFVNFVCGHLRVFHTTIWLKEDTEGFHYQSEWEFGLYYEQFLNVICLIEHTPRNTWWRLSNIGFFFLERSQFNNDVGRGKSYCQIILAQTLLLHSEIEIEKLQIGLIIEEWGEICGLGGSKCFQEFFLINIFWHSQDITVAP